jgi:hypothetical protein
MAIPVFSFCSPGFLNHTAVANTGVAIPVFKCQSIDIRVSSPTCFLVSLQMAGIHQLADCRPYAFLSTIDLDERAFYGSAKLCQFFGSKT